MCVFAETEGKNEAQKFITRSCPGRHLEQIKISISLTTIAGQKKGERKERKQRIREFAYVFYSSIWIGNNGGV